MISNFLSASKTILRSSPASICRPFVRSNPNFSTSLKPLSLLKNDTVAVFSKSASKYSNSDNSHLFRSVSLKRWLFGGSLFGWGLGAAAVMIVLGNDDEQKFSTVSAEEKSIQPQSHHHHADISIVKKSVKDEDGEFVIFAAQGMTIAEKLILWAICLLTVGIGYVLLYPLLEFQYYQRSIHDMRIDGKALKFTADLKDYYILKLKIFGINTATLGIYSLLGYSSKTFNSYLDHHISFDLD